MLDPLKYSSISRGNLWQREKSSGHLEILEALEVDRYDETRQFEESARAFEKLFLNHMDSRDQYAQNSDS